MHEEKGNVKLFTSTDHKGMYRIAFKHQTTNEVYSMQDLKDLRDLITEELGEECEHRGSENGICNGCGKEVYPQPLTEGEGECGSITLANGLKMEGPVEVLKGMLELIDTNTPFGKLKRNCVMGEKIYARDLVPVSEPQQESKEEEYIDGFKIECEHGSRGRCLKCLGLEEPPKKEVTWRNKYLVGTEEQVKELTRLGATDGVVHKFDEEEPSKKPSMTIGCMECGNNIRI